MTQAAGRELAYLQHIVRMLMMGGKMHTIEDILALPEGERAELIDGEMFMMATPTRRHQKIVGWLHTMIFNHIMRKGGKCEVDLSPFAVFLKNDRWNYVEPDVIVICDREKLDDMGCHGAPDWVLEVVSSSSIAMDYQRKLEAYRSAGVREYWIIDPMKETVTVYDFESGRTEPEVYRFTESVKPGTLKDLELDFGKLSEYLG